MQFSIQRFFLIAKLTGNFCNAADLPRGLYEDSCTDDVNLMQRGVDLQTPKHRASREGDNAAKGLALDAEVRESKAHRETTCIENYRRGLNGVRDGLGNNLQPSSFQVPKVSQKPLVIGAGIGSTATRSVWAALQLLGKKVWHCTDDNGCNMPSVTSIMAPNDYMSLFETKQREMSPIETQECLQQLSRYDYTNVANTYDAILDTPVAEVFLYMWRSFPNAKVLLTERNASKWVSHRLAAHHESAFAPMQNPCGLFIAYPETSKFSLQQLERLYVMHSDLVQCIVPENQLLRINLFEMDDDQQKGLMAKMAHFLNVSHPDAFLNTKFPHEGGANHGLRKQKVEGVNSSNTDAQQLS